MKTMLHICLSIFIILSMSACGAVTPQVTSELTPHESPQTASQTQAASGTYQDFAYNLTWSPDDRWLAASANTGLYLIDAATYQQKAVFPENIGTEVAFGVQWMAASNGQTVHVWDLKDNRLLFQQKDGPINFQSIAISRDDKLLVTGEQKRFRLWNLPDGGLVADIPVEGYVSNVAFNEDNNLIIITQYKALIQKWDVTNKKLISSFEIPRDVIFFTLSSDAKIVLADYGEAGFELWDIPNGKAQHYYKDAISAPGWHRLSADNRFASVWGYIMKDGKSGMSVWDLSDDSLVREFATPLINGDGWRGSGLNSDGSVLAASNNEGYVYFYNLGGGEKIGEFYLPYRFSSLRASSLQKR